MFEKILNLFFPNVCGFCNKINECGLCKKCEFMLEKYKLNCINDFRNIKEKKFEYLFSALKYEGIVRKKMISFKFGEKSYLYKTFAKIVINNSKIYGILKSYDIIVPVPMYKAKIKLRGYNQSELLAKEIAKKLDIKFEKDVLIKIKNTNVQSTLSKTERQNNVKGAFCIENEFKIKNKKVVLIDDIYTTGSTVNECSKILKKSGAEEILVITIAKD